MEPFVENLWNLLSDNLKIAVACRYLALPTISNIAKETNINKKVVSGEIDHLRSCGCIKEKYAMIRGHWSICYRYDCHETNEFVDLVIQKLGGIASNGPQSYRLR